MMIGLEDRGGAIRMDRIREAVSEFVAANEILGQKVLLIIPDNTRSGPVGDVFQAIHESLAPKCGALDCLVALGTHQPLSEAEICRRLSISAVERRSRYAAVRLFNHEWDKPETFRCIGRIPAAEISELSRGLLCEAVDVTVNRKVFDYDRLIILGPVFPHEVVGFSGGHKYLFPGIAGAEIIDLFHWLGALITNPLVNGNTWTETREVVERAACLLTVPRSLFALVAVQGILKGLFVGDPIAAWEQAAALSAQIHIVYHDRAYSTVLGIAPNMYEDLWTAGKVMYKLEPVVADGGTLIIYAPHISEISHTHGRIIDRIGYHTRDYFLSQPDRFSGVPRGVKAHCTHVKGIGTYQDGVERPRINVVLATGISPERCRQVNLGYLAPHEIAVADYENRETEGVLVVYHAGEILHRLSDGSVPTISNV
jgi:nickel-dependent lactate racemase